MYRIGQAARAVGVSPSALRLWERQGLVRPARSRGRYRLYSEDDVARLRRVRDLRKARLNAPGIRHVLHDGGTAGPGPHAERRFDGRPLRRLRLERGLSLREASARAGVSVSFLSALERGVSGASVATLQRLTAAYGTTMREVFGPPERDGSRNRLVRADARPVLRIGDGKVRIEQLARSATQLEPHVFVLAPGATSDGAYAHDGEELIYLLSGAATVWIGEDEAYRLERAGDTVTFPSTTPHRWRNDADGETRLLWINTPPTF
jgi:DNA-binding transcriptional MerR regulator/quercetin dioxygenase-like cupin family protein